ncbi:MAG: AEC family transporter [Firmicutes bacterium]|nr:AEC family transporter [Bacillota bacterium]
MDSMRLAFNAVFPLLAFMVIGYFLRSIKLLDEKTAAGLNKLVFKVFLPLSIFQSIYNADIGSAFDLKVALYVALTCVMSFIVITLLVGRPEKDAAVRPVMVQGIHKANYNLLAIPIVSSFYGNAIGMTAVLIIIITPIVNICSTIAFESARGGSASLPKMLKKIIMNPLVLSSVIGLLVNVSGLRLPTVVMSGVISKLSAMATPAAMLVLGSDFSVSSVKRWAGHLLKVCAGKLIVMPLVLVTGAVLIGIRGADLIAILIYSGSPAAVNSYSTAVSMGGNEELAGEIVAVTSLLSVFTLFVFLTVMGGMGLI